MDQKSTPITPSGNRILIKPIEKEETVSGAIIVPDMGEERPETGEVLAVGPGTWEFGVYIEPQTEVGQTVLIPKIGTFKVRFNNEEYYIVADKEILGVVNS